MAAPGTQEPAVLLPQLETLVTGPSATSQSGRGVWADLAPWQGLGPRPPCVATHGPAPAPPGGSDSSWLEASWPYKVVCGHLLGELQRLRPAPPMGTRARPGPEDGRGKGPAESGPVSEEGRARGARPRAAESGVQRVRCRDCCGHPRTCHSAVAFFRVTPCAPHRFGTPTSHPGEVPGSAPWAAEGGVRPGPFLPLPEKTLEAGLPGGPRPPPLVPRARPLP